jgi:hypothetical protein
VLVTMGETTLGILDFQEVLLEVAVLYELK